MTIYRLEKQNRVSFNLSHAPRKVWVLAAEPLDADFGFYGTKKAALADARKYGLRVSQELKIA